MDERIDGFLHPLPDLGSLPYLNFITNVNVDPRTGAANIETVATLRNSNKSLVRYHARLSAHVNGQAFVTAAGANELVFDGFAHVEQPASLILRMPNIPITANGGWATIAAFLAISARSFLLSAAARAVPPRFPMLTAALSLPCRWCIASPAS